MTEFLHVYTFPFHLLIKPSEKRKKIENDLAKFEKARKITCHQFNRFHFLYKTYDILKK